jgi:translation initiation factor 3 subunit A
MAAYYEKLTNLFWVSENYLFHAFAWYKYYSLCKEFNRGMSPETRQMQASAVLLAALSIPKTTSDIKSKNKPATGDRLAIQSTVEDDIAKEKMARMATLLGFHTREPSREAILAEIRAKNILNEVPQYLRELYVILEATTDPLDMVEKARPLLDTLRKETGVTAEALAGDEEEEDTTLGRYVQPLTNVLLLKLIFNISAAYHTISLDHVKKLTSGLGVSFEQMEKTIVLSSQSRALSVRIDHRAGCIRFGSANLESEEMRGQLSTLAKRLSIACNIISPPDVATIRSERAALYTEVRSTLESEHVATLERKVVIEKRKEEAERIVQEKLREEELQRKKEEMARKAEEERRLARESKLREKEKIQKIQDEMDAMEKKRYLTAMGRSVENMTVEELKEVDTAALAKEHAEKANKKKEGKYDIVCSSVFSFCAHLS